MGAVINVSWSTDSPDYEEKIRALARQLESMTGESVQVDIGITDNQGLPDTIQVGRILNKEREVR